MRKHEVRDDQVVVVLSKKEAVSLWENVDALIHTDETLSKWLHRAQQKLRSALDQVSV